MSGGVDVAIQLDQREQTVLPFQGFVEAIAALVFVAGADGRNLYVNRRFAEYTGLPREQLIGPAWLDALHPDDVQTVYRVWYEALEAGAPYSVEYRLRDSTGHYRWQLVRTEPMAWDGQKAAYWIGVLTDVHDRRLAEMAARDRAVQLSLAGEAAGVGIYDADLLTAELRWSAEAKRVFGQPPDVTPTVQLFYGMVHPEDLPAVERATARSMDPEDRHDDYRVEYRITCALDGATRWIDARGRTIFAGEGPERLAVRFIGSVLDVTDRKSAEVRLAEALAARDMLLSEVNHRVKNSLQIVASLLSLHGHRLPPGEARTALMEAQSRVGVVAAIHERLYMTGRHGALDLGPFLHDLVGDALRSGADGRIALDFTADDGLEADVTRAIPLAIILNELATNAVKYAWGECSRGTLSVTLRRLDGDLLISLADDGPGLPEGFSLAGGEGLGLRIVNSLVRQLHGAVEATSGPHGSTFRLTVPLDG